MEQSLQLKKLARLQLLREEQVLADVVYKCSNQLRQWAGLRRLKWIGKQARVAAVRGKRLAPGPLRALLATVELQGLEVRRHIADSYLLPVMCVLLAVLARLHWLLSSAEPREEHPEAEAPEPGLDRAEVRRMNAFSQLEHPEAPAAAGLLADTLRSVRVAPGLAQRLLETGYYLPPENPQRAPQASEDYLSEELVRRPKKPAKEKAQGPPVKRKLVHPFNGYALLEAAYLAPNPPQPPAPAPHPAAAPEPAPVPAPIPAPGGDSAAFAKTPRLHASESSLRKRPPARRFSYLCEYRRLQSLIKNCRN